MIPFNVPPCVGNEEKYIAQAIANHKLIMRRWRIYKKV